MNTSVTETFEAVLERQTQAFAQLTKILTNTKKKGVVNYTVEYLDTRLTMYQETWTQITSFNGYLQAYRKADRTKEDLPYFKAGTMDRMEDAYLEGWSYLREQLAHLRPPITPPAANSSMAFPATTVTRPAHVKLPRIELPKFDGDYTRWKSFESRFNSAVIVNETLTGAERLQYLLSALSGEALDAVQHLDVTDANFQIGWSRLKEIYDNERVIVHTLMQKLYSLKSIKLSQLDSLNQFTIHYRNTLEALHTLGRGTKEDHLVYFVSSKFDRELETEWNKTLGDARTYPTYAAMEKFVLEQTAAVKMSNQPTQQLQSSEGPAKPLRQKTNAHVIEESSTSPTCFLCKEAHVPRDCSVFRSLSPLARFETLKSQHACINCLGANHTVSNCPSTNVCRQCGEKHHTLLHRGEPRALSRPNTSGYRNNASSVQPSRLDASTPPPNTEESGSNVATHFAEASPNGSQTVLLATAMVKVFAPNGQSRLARALLDQGSQSSFVSTNLVQQLRLQKVRSPISVTGLGGEQTSNIDYSVQLRIGSSKQESPALSTRAFIVRGITQYVPPAVQIENYSALFDLALADPEPASKQRIELLLGADIFAQILRPGVRLTGNQGPIAQNTILGWILSGCINTPETHRFAVATHHGTNTDPLERALTRFWETEAVPETRILTPLEIECERHFEKTYSRDATGRFVVRLPFLKSVPEDFLGDSLRGATASLERLTRKLRENEAVRGEYNAFIREYESLGHMNRLDSVDRARNYIPHRAVLREESLTTKLRVVLNASSQTSSGYSLNDSLLTGPKLQLEITHILLAWRIHKYVLVADIEKMFRQILIHPQDRKYQCILWRNESNGNLEAFELNTVTYGTACAPYLSMRVIQQINKLEGPEYPLASPILRNSVYVDDVFMGAPDKQLLEQTRIQVCQLLSRGGFNLRKWAGNDAESLRSIPETTHSHASKIHTTLPNAVWRHVPTHCNPADLNSRGVSAEALLASTLWIEGPSWLKREEEDWPVQQTYETEEEKCKTAVHNTITIKDWDVLSRFSSWQRLIRVFCHVRRFINMVRKQTSTALPSFLTVAELRDSEITILRIIQRSSFATEIAAFARNKPLLNNSSLLPLNPFIDQYGVIRVGGRLRNSFLPWETKHPAILPKHHVSDLIIRESHLLSLHGGTQITTYTTRQKYWILGLRNSVRRVIHKCVKCARWRAETTTQVMQDLVTSRCRPSPPFSHIGVDYAGPYQVRDAPGRGKRTYKKYIAVFICFATHAVHLELVDDYSTAAFLAAFDRLTSRRGVPQTITSDNGTNFVGASNELARHFVEVTNSPELKNRCSTLRIQWKFYPPGAPHHGGMQEAAVRSTKHHLRRIMGSFAPTSEEMSTLLCKVEATLNSRPITRVRDDPECLEILTPGHFLTGSPLNSRPVPPLSDEPTTHLSRWQQVQKFHELLWRVWSREYLQELQSRYKWQTEQKGLTVGAVVLLDNPLLPPNKWELGRVIKTFPGKDGRVRVVEVKTASSTYKRPITRICRLPVDN